MKYVRTSVHFIRRVMRRLYFARKRFKISGILALLLSLLATAHIYSTTWVYPNTYLNGKNISYYPAPRVESFRKNILSTPYTMRVQNREYTYSYADYGIEIDALSLISDVFSPNTKRFPGNILALFSAFKYPRYIKTPLVFTQDFDSFIEQTVYDFSESANEIEFDQQQKLLTFVENEEKYRIDEQQFKQLLQTRVEDPTAPLYPKLTRVVNPQSVAIESVAERIKQMFLSPLTVYIESGGVTKSFVITERELADIATVSWQLTDSTDFIDIHIPLVTTLFNENVKKIRLLAKGNIASPKVIKDLEDALYSRFKGITVDAIKIYHDTGPNSDGLIAQKYVEVDISQQKMYTFAKGKLLKEYRVSTGLDYPTPVGEFSILNKTGLGYSSIYSVWMPWWMGFKYSDELHAYFGIHELPYALVSGNKIQRPANFIGTPNTGGCVALGVGDAQEVYRFADIGTKVVIYK